MQIKSTRNYYYKAMNSFLKRFIVGYTISVIFKLGGGGGVNNFFWVAKKLGDILAGLNLNNIENI